VDAPLALIAATIDLYGQTPDINPYRSVAPRSYGLWGIVCEQGVAKDKQ
jgi:hypothetical protein